jgi:hypothetical protein
MSERTQHQRRVWGNWALLGLMVLIAGVIFMAVPLLEPPSFLASHPYIREVGPPSALASGRTFPQWGFAVLPDGTGLYSVALPSPCPSPQVWAVPNMGGLAIRCWGGGGPTEASALPHLLIWISGSHTYVDPTHTVEPGYRATPAP